MIERIGPVCRFGPGGDYESVWPGEWMEQATQPKNAIGRLLDVISGMTDVLRGGERCPDPHHLFHRHGQMESPTALPR